MLNYRIRKMWLVCLATFLFSNSSLEAPVAPPLSGLTGSTQLIQLSTNTTRNAQHAPYTANITTSPDNSPRRPGYRYRVPGTNTWLVIRFHGARKIDHKSLVESLISAMDETRYDIEIIGGEKPVNEKEGPFNEHVPGCMFTISSTTNPDQVRRMTYSMRMDVLRGLYQVLVKAKREEAAEFIIHYEGLGVVGVGAIDQEKRNPRVTQ